MKKLIFLFFAIFLYSHSYSQQATSFNRVISYLGDSVSASSVIWSLTKLDTNYVIAINGSTDSIFYKLMVTKIDPSGNFIKAVEFSNDSVAFPVYPGNTVITDNDSNILVLSNSYDYYNTGDWDGYLIKFDKNLDTLWTRVYEIPATLAGCSPDTFAVNCHTAIKQTPDKAYIISGIYTRNCTIGNICPFLLKIDSVGNVIWWKVYPNLTEFYDIELASDSGFYFSQPLNGYLYLYKTDKLGYVEWNIKATSTSLLLGEPLIVEVIDSVHILVASAFYFDFYNDRAGLQLSLINVVTKSQVWEKDYYLFKSFRCPGLHQMIEIEAMPDGNIIICGTSMVANADSITGGYKGVLLKLNSIGDSLWSHAYYYGNFNDECQFNDLEFTVDGGFIATGYHLPYDGSYNMGAWLVKMDSLGNSPGCYTLDVVETRTDKASFSVYPNPASESFTLYYKPIGGCREAVFFLFDASGKEVVNKSLDISGTSTDINVSQIKAGLYVGKLYIDNEIVGKLKVVVE